MCVARSARVMQSGSFAEASPLVWLALFAWGGCSSPARVEQPSIFDEEVSVASNVDRGVCFDVLDQRYCPEQHAFVERRVPRFAPRTRMGFRCWGAGSERRCIDRGTGPRMECTDERCEQRGPRKPDDGEWECADMLGAALCRLRSPAYGVVPGPTDPAFVCGTRRGTDERICVDFSPDRPDARGWLCSFDHAHEEVRRCRAHEAGPELLAPCETSPDCAGGLECVASRCVPPSFTPVCFFDEDCGEGGRCVIGACAGGAP